MKNTFCGRSFLRAAILFVGLLVSLGAVKPVFALEDDGRPYVDFARKISSEADNGYVPLVINAYDTHALNILTNYLAKMERTSDSGVSGAQCAAFHDRSTNDRLIDIRYALGYFDDSTGLSFQWAGYDWGKSVSLDEGVWMAVRTLLMSSCANGSRRLCEFKELTSASDRLRNGETVLTRSMNVHGQSVEVRVTLTHASASPFYERNRGPLRAKQERYTRVSEENFFGGLRSADYVFYMGHARNGGGPDFNPPRLMANGKPNYLGYYRKAYPGISRMTKEIKSSGNKNVTLGLFACDSKLHFHRRLLANNKNQSMILTLGGEGMLDYTDTMMVSIGYLEGLLRGGCGAGLDQFARVTARERAAYQQYNVK